MLWKMWLLRPNPGLTSVDRLGPFETWEARRKIIEEIYEQDPQTQLIQLDIYKDGTVHASVPPRVRG